MKVFVFGSNLGGRHSKGSAAAALYQHGAIYGQGVGRQGNSYAIPTKDRNLKTLPLAEIRVYVNSFLDYARMHPELWFDVVKIGCGLAGYKDEDIAPMFADRPSNVKIHDDWEILLSHNGLCRFYGNLGLDP